MAQRGRPTVFSDDKVQKACDLAIQGCTDQEIAAALDIGTTTLYRWRHEHPAFREALEAGKAAADERVERSLYHRAIGYSHPAVKIMQYEGEVIVEPYTEHHPPDTGAMSLWLRNRKPEKWRDKTEHEHTGKVTLETLVAESQAKPK